MKFKEMQSHPSIHSCLYGRESVCVDLLTYLLDPFLARLIFGSPEEEGRKEKMKKGGSFYFILFYLCSNETLREKREGEAGGGREGGSSSWLPWQWGQIAERFADSIFLSPKKPPLTVKFYTGGQLEEEEFFRVYFFSRSAAPPLCILYFMREKKLSRWVTWSTNLISPTTIPIFRVDRNLGNCSVE